MTPRETYVRRPWRVATFAVVALVVAYVVAAIAR